MIAEGKIPPMDAEIGGRTFKQKQGVYLVSKDLLWNI